MTCVFGLPSASVGARALVFLLAFLLSPAPASALWHELASPAHKRARLLLDQARDNVREANRQLPADWRSLCTNTLTLAFDDEGSAALAARARALRDLSRQALRKRALLDGALERLTRARLLDPHDPELLYTFARTLMAWETPGALWTCTSERRDEEAAAALRALRAEHPEFLPDNVTFDLAVVQTRRAQFAEAAHAYTDAIALALDAEDTAVMRANLAEVTMLAGDLESAVMHYQRALRTTRGGRDYLLTLWGLAVALDRLGEHDAALEEARKAVDAESGRMQVLRSDGVFFEPAHEVHAYEGLGHEALALRPERTRDERARDLAQAAASYRAWLAAAGETHAFSAATRADLERVQGLLRASSRATRHLPKISAELLP